VEGYGEHGNEPPDIVTFGKFVDELSDYQLLKIYVSRRVPTRKSA
jgi:hypothetical protein